ncbi:hypothetical protein [Streptomyces sp. NPDC003006]
MRPGLLAVALLMPGALTGCGVEAREERESKPVGSAHEATGVEG